MFDPQDEIFANIKIKLKDCNDYLVRHDIKGFMISLRISAELVCRFIIVSEKKAEEFEKTFLPTLSIRFKGRQQLCSFHTMGLFLYETKLVPHYIYFLLEFIRKSCNEPAHNVLSGEEEKYLLTPNKSSYNNLFYWFFKAYLKQDVPEDYKELLNNYSLNNSFSLFLMAFSLKSEKFSFKDFYKQLDKSVWQPAGKKEMINEYFFYNHIDRFLRLNNSITGIQDIHPLSILSFSLNDIVKEQSHKHLKSFFLNNIHSIYDIDLKFNLFLTGELSPTLHFIPGLSIFFISFGFSIQDENQTMQDIIDFNYLLRGLEWNSISIRTSKNMHVNAIDNNELIESFLQQDSSRHFKSKKQNETDDDFFVWNMNLFMDFLLHDFPEGSLRQIIPLRYNIFTFMRSEEQIQNESLYKLLGLIACVYNTNFHPAKDFISKNIQFSNPFEQIYYAASDEGALIMQNSDNEYIIPFFDNFRDVIINRYVWVYKYLFFQKIMLLDGLDKLSASYGLNSSELKELSEELYAVLSLCDSKDISNVSSVNQFYNTMKEGMGIKHLYKQLSKRLKSISSIS